MRDHKVNELLHKLRFNSKSGVEKKSKSYAFIPDEVPFTNKKMKLIDLQCDEFQHLVPMVIDFLYYNAESLSEVKAYQLIDDTTRFYIKGEKKSALLQLEK